jgi:hypothetical protein
MWNLKVCLKGPVPYIEYPEICGTRILASKKTLKINAL